MILYIDGLIKKKIIKFVLLQNVLLENKKLTLIPLHR